jgi:peptide/nickel transport system permease protein
MGSDDLGRDHLARLLYAGQVSLGIALFAALLSLGIGVSLGVIAGYYGGVVDDVLNWVITTLTSIPQLFLLLIVSAVILQNRNMPEFMRGPFALTLILGLLGWTGTTRLVRGETLSIREREYVIGARAVGASPIRIMFAHIIPNLFSVVIITLALDIGGLILTESALSFLGLGVKAPYASWGNMLTQSQTFFTKGVHLVIAPGLLIVITVLCLYVIGDGLRDAFDPTTVD